MTIVFALTLFAIFFALATIHIYWAFGGQWGIKGSIPVNDQDDALFHPGLLATLLVAFALFSFGFFTLIKTCLINIQVPAWSLNYGQWIISGIFLLRAIGDFNYVGLFKKDRNTLFAENDTRYFSPLCFFISILSLSIQLLAN